MTWRAAWLLGLAGTLAAIALGGPAQLWDMAGIWLALAIIETVGQSWGKRMPRKITAEDAEYGRARPVRDGAYWRWEWVKAGAQLKAPMPRQAREGRG